SGRIPNPRCMIVASGRQQSSIAAEFEGGHIIAMNQRPPDYFPGGNVPHLNDSFGAASVSGDRQLLPLRRKLNLTNSFPRVKRADPPACECFPYLHALIVVRRGEPGPIRADSNSPDGIQI